VNNFSSVGGSEADVLSFVVPCMIAFTFCPGVERQGTINSEARQNAIQLCK
jgi:hypothetical protein